MTPAELLTEIAVEVILLSAGSLLLYVGAAKLARPAPIRLTISQLGLSDRSTVALAAALGLIELVGGFMVLGVRGGISALWVAGLGISFGGIGAWAALTGRSIECNCFGSPTSGSRLGWRQVAYLPFWAITALTTTTQAAEATPTDVRLLVVNVGLLGAFTYTFSRFFPRYRNARKARMAIRAWLIEGSAP